MFRTPIAMRAVNDHAATGGWEQSSLREWLADKGMATLPDDLRNQIRSVRKLTNNTVAGKKICYWERTPSADCSEGADSTYFNRVGKDGDVFCWATPGNAPDQKTYVLPGFCI